MKERSIASAKLISSHVGLILAMLAASAFLSGDSFFPLIITQTVLLILHFAGYWEFFGQRFRKVFCGGIELILMVLFIHRLARGIRMTFNPYILAVFLLIAVYLLVVLARILLVIFRKESRSVEIEFPFRNGQYLITDGGNSRISRLMNYHYFSPVHRKNRTNLSMLHATDIVKMKDEGPLWLPLKNEDYPVFDEQIYAPLDGHVVKVVSGLPDNEPWSGNYPYNTGNTVVIQQDDYFMLLGHLKNDSICVKEGDPVRTGDLIASAGNSGWTERPHLHMQLIKSETANYWSGRGIAILFKNKNLYKNRIVKI